MNKKTAQKQAENILLFFFQGVSIIRDGDYTPNQKVLSMALCEFLATGKNHLPDYDRLKKLLWATENFLTFCSLPPTMLEITPVQICSDEDSEFWSLAIQKKLFWDIDSMFEKYQINMISKYVSNGREIAKRLQTGKK